jgi:hypothetical protein
MTAHHDLDTELNAFLREGPTELPNESFDAVRDRTEQTGQRVVIGPWRLPEMNKMLAAGLGAAAVVVVLLVGAQLLRLPSGGIGGDPTPTPEPTPTPSLTATPEPTPQGLLPEGPHNLWRRDLGMTISVTIPAAGWYGEPGEGILVKNDNPDAPDGAGMIVFAQTNDLLVGLGDLYVYGDPCRWASTKPEAPVTTVDEAVAALSAQASRNASTPMDVRVDGHPGKAITLHVPDDAVFSDCDGGEFRTLVEGDDGARFHQDPGQIDLLSVLDVDGELVIIDVGYYEGTPESVLDEMGAIVESATLERTP